MKFRFFSYFSAAMFIVFQSCDLHAHFLDQITSNDWVRIVSLSILVIYLIMVFGGRLGIKKFVGILGLYGGIMMLGVGVYTYVKRPPGEPMDGFTQEVLQELNPSSGVMTREPLRSLSESESVKIIRGDQTIRFKKSDDGHFYVTLRVGETSVRFLLDTGATRVIIGESDAQRLGVDLSSLEYKYPTHTANGMIQTAFTTIASMTLGSFTAYHVPAAVSRSKDSPPILGMSFLDKIPSWTIKGDQLIFTLQ